MRDALLLSTHGLWSKRRGISVLKESNANEMVVKRLGLFGVAARKGLVSLMALGIGLLDSYGEHDFLSTLQCHVHFIVYSEELNRI